MSDEAEKPCSVTLTTRSTNGVAIHLPCVEGRGHSGPHTYFKEKKVEPSEEKVVANHSEACTQHQVAHPGRCICQERKTQERQAAAATSKRLHHVFGKLEIDIVVMAESEEEAIKLAMENWYEDVNETGIEPHLQAEQVSEAYQLNWMTKEEREDFVPCGASDETVN